MQSELGFVQVQNAFTTALIALANSLDPPPVELPVTPHPGPQELLLETDVDEVLFGGARGGGKSFGFLLEFCKHAQEFGRSARGLILRRCAGDLDDLISDSRLIFPSIGAVWSASNNMWTVPGGAQLKFRHLDREQDADKYKGHQYTRIYVEEADTYTSMAPINLLRGALRSPQGTPCRLFLNANPGGVGHNWLKARFIDAGEPGTVITDPETGSTRIFIPALLQDNPTLMENDPEYVNRLKHAGADWLVRAWLDGNWNIVAGGMFDDVWSDRCHVVQPFRIPDSWYIDRGFDWGSSAPFAVLWFAESNGEEAHYFDGTTVCYPPGTIVIFAEWYGWNGKANEGTRLLARDIARGIVEREDAMGYYVEPGPADNMIYVRDRGPSIADEMQEIGIGWERSDKAPGSRIAGWELIRQRLTATAQSPMEEPGLVVFKTCEQTRRTLPGLARNTRQLDEIADGQEDHIADVIRYRLRMPVREVSVGRAPWSR